MLALPTREVDNCVCTQLSQQGCQHTYLLETLKCLAILLIHRCMVLAFCGCGSNPSYLQDKKALLIVKSKHLRKYSNTDEEEIIELL